MHDGVHLPTHIQVVAHVDAGEGESLSDDEVPEVGQVARAQVVEADDLVAAVEEDLADVGAQESLPPR